METKPLKLFSKSAVETDWHCPREYYYAYCYEGKGITNTNTSLELFFGTVIHDALGAIALQHDVAGEADIDQIAELARSEMVAALEPIIKDQGHDGYEFMNEQAALTEGLVRGFHKHTWPILLEQYPVIKLVEQPMVLKLETTGMMSKPDLVLADKEGNNWYIEYKTTSSKRPEWTNSWDLAVQVHSTIKALEDKLGEKVAGVIIQGLYKGYESYGKLSSPFVYAYKRAGSPPFYKEEIAYEYKSGFKRTPTWDLPGGVKEWVARMPANVLGDQFPRTPPIFINEDLIQAYFRQREVRESIISGAMIHLADPEVAEDVKQWQMDAVFPQRFDQCKPAWNKGEACRYATLCHGPKGLDPLSHGYVWRDESHLLPFKDVLDDGTESEKTD